MFVARLINFRLLGKSILFFDETSISLWEKGQKTWFHPERPIQQVLNKKRYKGVTVMGIIGEEFDHIVFGLAESTNTMEVLQYFTQVVNILKDPSNTVVVVDNHSAHQGK